MMNYSKTIEYITHTDWKGSSLGLDRMRELMNYLDNPQDKIKVIHVAGTNGKGSCCSMLLEILKQAGYKVGMYTSPHLINFEERFVINGEQIKKKDFCEVASIIQKQSKKMEDQPTEFEILTAMAYEYFYLQKVDVAIMEVGMGGRLDATNIITKPLLSIIMNIGLDHTDILGNTLSKIAYEKAGIIKEKTNVVAYGNTKEVTKVFEKISKERKAKLKIVDFSSIKSIKEDIDYQIFDYSKYHNIELALLGKHQLKNAAVVIESINVLKRKGFKISTKQLRSGFKNVSWNARLSIISKSPLLIVDGAHNPQCAKALKDSLPSLIKKKKAIFLCGILKDKDYEKVMDMMIPFASEFICLTPFSPRALKAEELVSFLKKKKQKAMAAKDIKEGIELALEKAKEDDIIIAFGSLYLVGYIISEYQNLKGVLNND